METISSKACDIYGSVLCCIAFQRDSLLFNQYFYQLSPCNICLIVNVPGYTHFILCKYLFNVFSSHQTDSLTLVTLISYKECIITIRMCCFLVPITYWYFYLFRISILEPFLLIDG